MRYLKFYDFCPYYILPNDPQHNAGALHLLPHRGTTLDPVGVKLYLDRARIEVVDIDLDLESVLVAEGF